MLCTSALILSVVFGSCGHRRQLPPGAPRAEVTAETREEEEKPVPGPRAGVTGIDSLRQCYDSLVSRYHATVKANEKLQTRNSKMDSAIRLLQHELAAIRKQGNEPGVRNVQSAPVANSRLREELKEVKAANETLSELGSVLHVSNFRILPIHVSASGRRVKLTMKAKKTNDLRILFDIDQNYVAGKGEKELYLVITDPRGKLQKVEDWVPGKIKNFNGDVVPYTLEKKVVMKENLPSKNVEINCKLDQLMQKGKFRFAIYQNGYVIGEKTLLLD